jgi:hypothetical protein
MIAFFFNNIFESYNVNEKRSQEKRSSAGKKISKIKFCRTLDLNLSQK